MGKCWISQPCFITGGWLCSFLTIPRYAAASLALRFEHLWALRSPAPYKQQIRVPRFDLPFPQTNMPSQQIAHVHSESNVPIRNLGLKPPRSSTKSQARRVPFSAVLAFAQISTWVYQNSHKPHHRFTNPRALTSSSFRVLLSWMRSFVEKCPRCFFKHGIRWHTQCGAPLRRNR